MGYSRTFKAPTREEADALADAFIATMDPYRQPYKGFYGPSPEGEGYCVTVCWFNLD